MHFTVHKMTHQLFFVYIYIYIYVLNFQIKCLSISSINIKQLLHPSETQACIPQYHGVGNCISINYNNYKYTTLILKGYGTWFRWHSVYRFHLEESLWHSAYKLDLDASVHRPHLDGIVLVYTSMLWSWKIHLSSIDVSNMKILELHPWLSKVYGCTGY